MLIKLFRRFLAALLMLLGAGLLVSLLLAIVPDAYTTDGFWTRSLKNFWTFLTFSYSMRSSLHLGEVLISAGQKSMFLILFSLLLSALIGIPLAIWTARERDNRIGRLVQSVVHAMSSIPVLIWTLLLLAFVTRFFSKLPIYDMLDGASGIWVVVVYLLPVFCLTFGDGMLSDIIRQIQAETAHILEQDYIRAVRARNVSLNRHITRSLLIPIVSTFSGKMAYLVSGTVVVEYVFNWRGLGFEILSAISTTSQKEYGLILAATMLLVGLVILLNLLNEIVAVIVDPRLNK